MIKWHATEGPFFSEPRASTTEIEMDTSLERERKAGERRRQKFGGGVKRLWDREGGFLSMSNTKRMPRKDENCSLVTRTLAGGLPPGLESDAASRSRMYWKVVGKRATKKHCSRLQRMNA